jgi:hypothetical protein
MAAKIAHRANRHRPDHEMSCCTGALPGVGDVVGGSFVTGVTTYATTLSEAFAAQVAERDEAQTASHRTQVRRPNRSALHDKGKR